MRTLFTGLLLGTRLLCAASIEVRDTIKTDAVWQPDTVKVTGEVTVADGVTLTITPGTRVEFQGHFKLNVRGRLLAEGTQADSVVFTAGDTAVGWHGIRFDGTSPSNDTSRLEYARLEYGRATGSGFDVCGGALFVHSFSKLTVSRVNIRLNRCSGINSAGGGVYAFASSLVLDRVDISRNRGGWDGGGLYCGPGSPRLTGVIITDNMSDYGGGVYCASSSPVLNDVIVSRNTAVYGGGILCDSASPVLTGGIVSDNQALGATGYGGGLYCSNSAPRLTGVVIRNNRANVGGGLICYTSPMVMVDVVIGRNTAYRFGGGLYLSRSNTVLTNATVGNNVLYGPVSTGAGIYCVQSSLALTNSILWHNRSSLGADPLYLKDCDPDPVILYCNLEGGRENIHGEGADTAYAGVYQDNLDTVPLFADTASGDFQLQQGSSCIDRGRPDTSGLGLPALDAAGNPRIFGGRVDMGAYENQGADHVEMSRLPAGTCLLQNRPNPFKTATLLHFPNPSGDAAIAVFSIHGRNVLSAKNVKGDGFRLDLSGLNSGLYIVSVVSGKTRYQRAVTLIK